MHSFVYIKIWLINASPARTHNFQIGVHGTNLALHTGIGYNFNINSPKKKEDNENFIFCIIQFTNIHTFFKGYHVITSLTITVTKTENWIWLVKN